MASLNEVNLIGHLGGDPETRFTPGGDAVCNFNMATSEKWTGKNGNPEERTEWHRIVVWGKLAELCGKYLAKGRQAFVKGSLQTRSYEKDGVTRYVTEIKARDVQFLDSKPESGAPA
jgi:single-strand DNA-binding protein